MQITLNITHVPLLEKMLIVQEVKEKSVYESYSKLKSKACDIPEWHYFFILNKTEN